MSEALSAEYFEGRPPIGRMIGRGTGAPAEIEIIGVFGNAWYHEVRGKLANQTFINPDPFIDRIRGINLYVICARGGSRRAIPALRAQVNRIDPQLVISRGRNTGIRRETRWVSFVGTVSSDHTCSRNAKNNKQGDSEVFLYLTASVHSSNVEYLCIWINCIKDSPPANS